MSSSPTPSFTLHSNSSQFSSAVVTIPATYVKKLYAQASMAQQAEVHTFGFPKGNTPLSYIEKNFQPHLVDHVKEFFFKYFVINWLYKELYSKKIYLAGEPFLQDISLQPHQDARFSFSLTLAPSITLQGWKRLPFKAPKRKNYKDLDRQVENFLKEEQTAEKKEVDNLIKTGDWINFTVCLLNNRDKPLLGSYKENLWLKIGHEEADQPFQSLFIGKKTGDSFVTDHDCLQEYFSSHLDTHYKFEVTVVDRLPHTFFCVEHFKKHFRIRNSKELHQKLIEVFSYRNDISQRRAMAEESLKLLLSKHAFIVPQHLILRQQKIILDLVHDTPDYQVYKMQPDFREKITALAEKQVKEDVFIHQLAFHENIGITNTDIKGYLNLGNRPRTSEFIYFEPPSTKFLGHEIPISASLLSQCCLKEKTLNHAIHHLIKSKPGI
ncbi:MAG: FKBP-type peptidyl-prolyl cis-trans isomerase (trigger factor) [Alteromonas naphthalenivorans]|jgi:FKBP-type peptidyl-prolyl cis-trans isomerase (trigger factor)